MSLTYLQAAAIIAGHATFTKALISFTIRSYSLFEKDEERVSRRMSNVYVQEFLKAQLNESEYSALFVSIFLYLHSVNGSDGVGNIAATMAVLGQIGYIWIRIFAGYPSIPLMACVGTRYFGLITAVYELWKLAF